MLVLSPVFPASMALKVKFDQISCPFFWLASCPLLAVAFSCLLTPSSWFEFITQSGTSHGRLVSITAILLIAWHLGGCIFLIGSKNKLQQFLSVVFFVVPAFVILPTIPFLYHLLAQPVWAIERSLLNYRY